jgi:peptidoglycan/xylan/chitin deacetylase (PgdA/CDA1 family)
MPLEEFARLQSDGDLPRDAVALTFDDGYACAIEAAAPLLSRLGLPATVFLPAELICRRREFWWDELARIVLEFRGAAIALDEREFAVPPPDARDVHWLPDEPPATRRQRLFLQLWSRLHDTAPGALDAAMEQLRDHAQGPMEPRDSHRPLTPEELRSAASACFSFGSHGLSHAALPRLGSEAKAREIRESRSRCAELTGDVPTAFAYPHGELDEECVQLVREAGYACACATGDSLVKPDSDLFRLPRLRVGNWEAAHLRDMLGG